ncbi:MAG: TIR domain-containing protein, partial [Sphingomonadales bacterium]|nr:TIR domain-containing protein [Sphingomonadales bacterium]
MSEVFISYNRQDQDHARLFAEGFKAAGFDVWWDVSLQTGEAWDAVTENALNEAEAVVVLWSPRSVNSRWVRSEASVAQRNGTLIPVMMEACTRPVMFELTQSADLTEWVGDQSDPKWQHLVTDVRAHLKRRERLATSNGAPQRTLGTVSSERRQVAVLSLALAPEGDGTELDPEEWDDAVEHFRSAVTKVLSDSDARVLQAGATYTLIFGLDQVTEQDALRATQVALAIAEAVGTICLADGATARVRGGIECGSVVTGGQGGSPAGPALDGAAQLQTTAPPGSIIIGNSVATIAGGYLELERAGPRAFRVLGESASHTRFDLSRARGLSRFVGRSDDFELLVRGLERAANGTGQMIGIMAEAGTGKSRLCYEFGELCRSHDIPVYYGSGSQQDRNTPLLAIIEVLRSFFAADPQDDAATARDKI